MPDLKNLVPELKIKLAMFQRACSAAKIDIIITQGFRSPAYQDALYAQGRTAPGKIVTYLRGTGPNPSKHCQGKAFDICFLANKKAYYLPTTAAIWQTVGNLGIKCGLIWGGKPPKDWGTFRDFPHFQIN